jgi:hypothetical protein
VKVRLAIQRYVNVINCASHVCRKLVALCLVLLVPSNCQGTIVVLINNGDTLWIGTDSLQGNNTKTATRVACKINKERTFYWAVATPVVADTATNFEFSKVVTAAHLTGTLEHKMKMFIERAKVPLSVELATIKRTYPSDLANFLTYKALFQVLFVGAENGHTRFIWASLNVRESGRKLEIISQGPQTTHSPKGVFTMGEDEAAKAYISDHIDQNPVTLLRDSISRQETAEPDVVGGAISIAKIDPTGLTWIQKGECQ